MNNVFKQQIEALAQVGLRLQDGLDAAVELILSKKGKVVVTGIGKSGIVAHKIAATLAQTRHRRRRGRGASVECGPAHATA